MEEWIVTLYNKEDLDDFYNDMETPGGNLYIPDRAVPVRERRPISRNTHYMLTEEEANQVREDPRVWDVELRKLIEGLTRPMGYKITNGDFAKNYDSTVTDLNWGLLRHSEETNRLNWGDDSTPSAISDLTITASGKNVDVVIFDGHIDPAHPEFAVNDDGTGGSRVVQENWFSHGGSGTYVYTPYVDGVSEATDDNDHGCHVAGTVAGNTMGWARDANIYNINPYGTNPNGSMSSTMFDYVRTWHNQKPINPDTGRRNPTVTNHSYGSVITAGQGDFGDPYRLVYRGTDFNPGRTLTQAELQARGCYCPNANLEMNIPYYFTARNADIQDAIDDGIIVVVAAGNDSWKTVNSTDQDFNNTIYLPYLGVNYVWYLHRGTGSGAGYEPTINVGAMDHTVDERKATFSECGSVVDIYAAGVAINSSLHTSYFYGGADPRNGSYYRGKYQGTSMASPQVCGVLAILAESWPNMSQTQAQQWLTDNAEDDAMFDSEADDPMDRTSLQGAPNRILRWFNQRVESGNSFPKKNFAGRPTSGAVYPRQRIRKRG